MTMVSMRTSFLSLLDLLAIDILRHQLRRIFADSGHEVRRVPKVSVPELVLEFGESHKQVSGRVSLENLDDIRKKVLRRTPHKKMNTPSVE